MVDECVVGVDDGWLIPDEMWTRIEALLPTAKSHPKGGRPMVPARPCMDGIFYLLRTGCQWKALPKCFGAASTVHDRFQEWRGGGVFERLWEAGLVEYDACLGLDWQWQSMDGAMSKAPLGGKRHGAKPD
jgi:putative transposase